MSTYIDFIENLSEDISLAEEFKNAVTNFSSEKLSSWFKEQGYMVNTDVCTKMIANNKADPGNKASIDPRAY